jgi:MFS family permease
MPAPDQAEPQGLLAAFASIRDPRIAMGLWLTTIAGLAFGVLDVLAPLRLNALGAAPVVIGATFLASAAVEAGLSPLSGRLSDRRGRYFPIRISLLTGVAVSLLAPVLAPLAVLIAMLVIGMPAFGTLFAPSSAMLSDAADRLELHQGLAFGLANLAWATGQTIAASASGAIAQATTDFVPYALLAATCLATFLGTLRRRSADGGAR